MTIHDTATNALTCVSDYWLPAHRK